MKKIYSKPEIAVSEFDSEDVVRASGQGSGTLGYDDMNSAGKSEYSVFTAVKFQF